MPEAEVDETGIAQAATRFSERAARLKGLALKSPDFREVCADYALALKSLAGFEARADAAERAEIGDYRRVIAELETEIGHYLEEAGPEG